jgi:NADPH:quinone reductase-like Zn-dependent oxidoreductase
MRAVLVSEHGGLDVLKVVDVTPPTPGPGEVQVAVRASGLNHLDTWVRRGVPGHVFPLPMITGCDGAGVVSAVGPGVVNVKEGDEVVLAPGYACGHCLACAEGRDNLCRQFGILGETRNGTNAELIVVPAVNALPKPKGVSFPDAASVPLVFLTAWTMLVDRAGVRAGEVVLVHAAGSGIGIAAIQIARLWGATVIATASTEEKRRRALELGADHAVDYTEDAWPRRVFDLSGKRGAHVVVEHVGAPTFAGSLKSLGKGGRLVTCGATAGPEVTIDLRPIFFKSLSILGSTMGSRGTVLRILQLLGEGKLRAVVDRVMPLEQVREAHRLMGQRTPFGKIVLAVPG